MISRRRFLAASGAAALTATAVRGQEELELPQTEFPLEKEFMPQPVSLRANYEVGHILVMPRTHFLYHVIAPNRAMRYGVGVGRAGLSFQGEASIDVKKEWPTWRPTDEMIERDPHLYGRFRDRPDYAMPGGPSNPLGARALYLFQNGRDTYYRIHGTIEPQSIGRSVSSGCIRMLNSHVVYLYQRVPIGTRVTVF